MTSVVKKGVGRLDILSLSHNYSIIMRIAILSNSYGEDRSGAIIARELKKFCPDLRISGFPLISFGKEYGKRGIEVIGGSPSPPSGGFFLKSIEGFIQDIVDCFTIPFTYIKRLHRIKDSIGMVIVVGDVPLLLLGWMALRRKAYFLAPCKSDWMAPHLSIERFIIKRLTEKMFTHDEFTANKMREKGIDALFPGNPMMDELDPEGRFEPPDGKTLIGILPGSREESYGNMKRIGKIIKILNRKRDDLHFAVALSNTVDSSRMKSIIDEIDADVDMVEGAFVDILKGSSLVISLAGTATEQAVGLGIPVVSFRGTGAQTTKRRLVGQKKLLSKAFRLVEYIPETIVDEIEKILDNESLKGEMKIEGLKRMGPGGGAGRIADYILKREGIG